MATKKRNKRGKISSFQKLMKSAGNMTYKDLKRHCVVRGMPFQEIVDSTVPGLQNWLHYHSNNEIDSTLLDKFDNWIEEILRNRGQEQLIHPQLRLGYVGEKDEETGEVKTKRVKGIKKKKKKKEKTADGIYTGTKKALTFECQQDDISMEDTITRVMEEFPDASEKSIKIWWKKSRRMHKKD